MRPDRAICTTEQISTAFGKMYVHVEVDARGRPIGGAISTPQKDPGGAITRLVHQLAAGLDAALRHSGPTSSQERDDG